jgi:hypothetical protein
MKRNLEIHRTPVKRGNRVRCVDLHLEHSLHGLLQSAIIDPVGEKKERIYSGRIRSVLSKDGMMFEFQTQPTMTRDAIVGEAKVPPGGLSKVVSIPISEVAHVYVSELDLLASAV